MEIDTSERSFQNYSPGFSKYPKKVTEKTFLNNNCRKNPGHRDFILLKNLSEDRLEDLLPFAYINAKATLRLIHECLAPLVVRIRTVGVSPGRYKSHWYGGKAFQKSLCRVASGWICKLELTDASTTSEKNVQGSLGSTVKHGVVHIATAKHVIFDETEARYAKCDLFFEDDGCFRGPDEYDCETITGFSFADSDSDNDVVILKSALNDKRIINKLLKAFLDFQKLFRGSMEQRQTRKEQGFCVTVSHPHGVSKHVSIGRWAKKNRKFDDLEEKCDSFSSAQWSDVPFEPVSIVDVKRFAGKQEDSSLLKKENAQYIYNIPTCPGSSGAPVLIFDPSLSNINDEDLPIGTFINHRSFKKSTKTSKSADIAKMTERKEDLTKLLTKISPTFEVTRQKNGELDSEIKIISHEEELNEKKLSNEQLYDKSTLLANIVAYFLKNVAGKYQKSKELDSFIENADIKKSPEEIRPSTMSQLSWSLQQTVRKEQDDEIDVEESTSNKRGREDPFIETDQDELRQQRKMKLKAKKRRHPSINEHRRQEEQTGKQIRLETKEKDEVLLEHKKPQFQQETVLLGEVKEGSVCGFRKNGVTIDFEKTARRCRHHLTTRNVKNILGSVSGSVGGVILGSVSGSIGGAIGAVGGIVCAMGGMLGTASVKLARAVGGFKINHDRSTVKSPQESGNELEKMIQTPDEKRHHGKRKTRRKERGVEGNQRKQPELTNDERLRKSEHACRNSQLDLSEMTVQNEADMVSLIVDVAFPNGHRKACQIYFNLKTVEQEKKRLLDTEGYMNADYYRMYLVHNGEINPDEKLMDDGCLMLTFLAELATGDICFLIKKINDLPNDPVNADEFGVQLKPQHMA